CACLANSRGTSAISNANAMGRPAAATRGAQFALAPAATHASRTGSRPERTLQTCIVLWPSSQVSRARGQSESAQSTERPARSASATDGEGREVGAVRLSFHPAGHILGSAQGRIEQEGAVWVAAGDYKREADPTCAPFEPLRCDVLVTEASYALPIFRWDDPREVIGEIHRRWQGNARRASLLFCYVLGQAQRVLAGLDELTDRPVYVHGALEAITGIYREAGVRMSS